VLLHAGICDSRMWERQMTTLAGAGRVVACDMRGFGRMPAATSDYIDAADVAELIEAEGLAPAVLVGASMGGGVAIDLAEARPELVSGLVLVATTHPEQEWTEHMDAYGRREGELWDAGDVEGLVELNLEIWIDGPTRSAADVDPEMRAFVGGMLRDAVLLQMAVPEIEHGDLVEDKAPGLAEITVPTLVLAGELDVPEMAASAARLAADIPAARAESIAGASHLPSLERPERFDELVLGFLADLPVQPPG
jgi:3-oxoadipate enol-lactonase